MDPTSNIKLTKVTPSSQTNLPQHVKKAGTPDVQLGTSVGNVGGHKPIAKPKKALAPLPSFVAVGTEPERGRYKVGARRMYPAESQEHYRLHVVLRKMNLLALIDLIIAREEMLKQAPPRDWGMLIDLFNQAHVGPYLTLDRMLRGDQLSGMEMGKRPRITSRLGLFGPFLRMGIAAGGHTKIGAVVGTAVNASTMFAQPFIATNQQITQVAIAGAVKMGNINVGPTRDAEVLSPLEVDAAMVRVKEKFEAMKPQFQASRPELQALIKEVINELAFLKSDDVEKARDEAVEEEAEVHEVEAGTSAQGDKSRVALPLLPEEFDDKLRELVPEFYNPPEGGLMSADDATASMKKLVTSAISDRHSPETVATKLRALQSELATADASVVGSSAAKHIEQAVKTALAEKKKEVPEDMTEEEHDFFVDLINTAKEANLLSQYAEVNVEEAGRVRSIARGQATARYARLVSLALFGIASEWMVRKLATQRTDTTQTHPADDTHLEPYHPLVQNTLSMYPFIQLALTEGYLWLNSNVAGKSDEPRRMEQTKKVTIMTMNLTRRSGDMLSDTGTTMPQLREARRQIADAPDYETQRAIFERVADIDEARDQVTMPEKKSLGQLKIVWQGKIKTLKEQLAGTTELGAGAAIQARIDTWNDNIRHLEAGMKNKQPNSLDWTHISPEGQAELADALDEDCYVTVAKRAAQALKATPAEFLSQVEQLAKNSVQMAGSSSVQIFVNSIESLVTAFHGGEVHYYAKIATGLWFAGIGWRILDRVKDTTQMKIKGRTKLGNELKKPDDDDSFTFWKPKVEKVSTARILVPGTKANRRIISLVLTKHDMFPGDGFVIVGINDYRSWRRAKVDDPSKLIKAEMNSQEVKDTIEALKRNKAVMAEDPRINDRGDAVITVEIDDDEEAGQTREPRTGDDDEPGDDAG